MHCLDEGWEKGWVCICWSKVEVEVKVKKEGGRRLQKCSSEGDCLIMGRGKGRDGEAVRGTPYS